MQVNKVTVESSVVDDLKFLHGIDALEEIKALILKTTGQIAEIEITYNGDRDEDQSNARQSAGN